MAEANIKVPVKVTHVHRLEIGEGVFWLSVWTIVAVSLIALVSILAKRSLAGDELVAKSLDPVAYACAIGTNSTLSNQCMALLARKN